LAAAQRILTAKAASSHLRLMRNYLTSIFAMSIQSGPGNSLKAALRAEIKGRLNCLSNVDINLHSNVVLHSLASLPEFQACKCICIYLSMPSSEIQTFGAIQRSFQMEKRVFIPKVTGKLAEDMIMFELDSIELINSFPRSKWGIPEPPKELIESYEDMTKSGLIDLILVPGVAFDVNCGRIGHGKGYYGKSNKILTIFQNLR
jgi:5-formyltetrahydrofolate cyclo-ligase